MVHKVGPDGEHFTTETLYAVMLPNGTWHQLGRNRFTEDECHSNTFFKSKMDAIGVIRDLVNAARELGVVDYAPELHKFERKKVWTKPVYVGSEFDKYGDVKQ